MLIIIDPRKIDAIDKINKIIEQVLILLLFTVLLLITFLAFDVNLFIITLVNSPKEFLSIATYLLLKYTITKLSVIYKFDISVYKTSYLASLLVDLLFIIKLCS